ncbi:LIM domain protein [Dictyocaulus viviparus]|uniref:LIM domain protein n=1 Tax=Dictyocaulus viviparus TaxID=29172 RepID=A0A0D8XT02_DICVI|nr:LIM domain protein [Dictyocaulus viviparus]
MKRIRTVDNYQQNSRNEMYYERIVFHVNCFKCKTCGCKLAGSSFYNIDDAPTCDSCYQSLCLTYEKISVVKK